MLKRTALYTAHLRHHAHMTPFAGFSMPLRYTSTVEEHMAVRKQVGLFDVSHMSKFWIEGETAYEFLQHVLTNDISKLSVGDARYSCMTNARGGVMDDVVLYRLAKERYMFIGNAIRKHDDWGWLLQQNVKHKAALSDQSDRLSILALQGPKAQELLQQLTDIDLNAIPYYCFSKGVVHKIEQVIVSNTGYTGSDGFELYVSNKQAEALWNKLILLGKDYGLLLAGLGARDTLRIEAGYCLYGQDIDEILTPFEAGLGWTVKFNKRFIGDDILRKQKENGVKRRLILLQVDGKSIPRKGSEVMNKEGLKVGEVTSGSFSPLLEHGIALAYVDSTYSKEHTAVCVLIRDKSLQAQVIKPKKWKNTS